ncbi:DUF4336 domain-containing protein [Microseira wollei]|uniref:DUF4336 domain-containing protein n=1 Tax=Microseira wollei NIES-4236 TaxID=2530354 RepID=A0AAV3XD62_9CYAN|nr:DUF4336 domain-containing protein [Microseira wollei]GET37347.1 hypothetical protein MiSe_21000 [Microseira wollei NIES-4236]
MNAHPNDFSWHFWPALPIYPYSKRRTLRKEVIKDTVWTFDQLQGIFYVVVPIRMTVVKLSKGGLLIYAPVAPTPECIRLVKELVAQHGEVKYIILPTISGLEHKIFVGPFARYFPNAQVFVAPSQWSFPLNLPLNWLGFPGKRTFILPEDCTKTPFADDFDYAILGPIYLGLGKFAEVAFFHKTTNTLLVTDSVVVIPEEAPEIVQIDPYPLLFHARNHASEIVFDSPANRRKGWQRVSLFAFYFRPSVLETIKLGQAFRDSLQAPDRSRKAYFGLYPFKWQKNWKQSFDALRGGGRLLVAPILQTLILNRAPQETIDWADKIASWDFQRIVPCHFSCPIEASPGQFRQAFAFLEKGYSGFEEDFELLREIDEGLNRLGIVPPRKEKI